jgi:hypothetical protein
VLPNEAWLEGLHLCDFVVGHNQIIENLTLGDHSDYWGKINLTSSPRQMAPLQGRWKSTLLKNSGLSKMGEPI